VLAAVAGPTPLWYATRASGYTALVLLSASVALGVFTSSRESRRQWPRFVIQSLHRNLSLLVGVFLIIHILTSIIDPFAKLTFLDAFVPFTASYRPLWLGLGVVAFELLIAITVTSLMRHRLGWRSWRVVHLLAYACWPVAVIHGVATGTDTKAPWALLLVAACVLAVVVALVWRLARAGSRFAALRVFAIAGTCVATGLLVVWMFSGPLERGWAKSAGTPADLLSGSAGGPATPSRPTALSTGLNDQLVGSIVRSAANVTATLTDTRDNTLELVVVAKADGSGTLTVTRSGTRVCVSPATIGSSAVTAHCGAVLTTIQVVDEGNGSIRGTLITQQGAS
jgi:methionine sulfoxide reductase heme-binding subunit